jgi:hypothetical protein
MIRERLLPELRKRFGDRPFQYSQPPDPIARLDSGRSEIGELQVYDDGDEVTVAIHEISHGHFNLYEEGIPEAERVEWIVKSVLSFLEALFADRVLLFRSPNRRMGGWRVLDAPVENVDSGDGQEYFVWSGRRLA